MRKTGTVYTLFVPQQGVGTRSVRTKMRAGSSLLLCLPCRVDISVTGKYAL